MEKAVIKRHVMDIEFVCPTTKHRVATTINDPYIQHRQHYEDWDYTCIEVQCRACGKSHTYEI